MKYFTKIIVSAATIVCCLYFLTAAAQIKPTSAAERLKGLEKRKTLEQNSLLKDIQYKNIGPVQMNGRVVDAAVNPADPTEFYVAYASGGLWHTVNNGLSFEPVFDKEDAISVGDIAVNWKEKIIWVGTGEVNSSRSSYSGTGIYKSSNGGKSWQYMGLPESHHIGAIILHPTNPDIVWVAALGHLYSPNKERGVYKTTDGGKTWKQTLAVDENTGAVEMDINLQNPDELYACMWYRTRRAWDFVPTGATSGIYKSTDGGNSWKLITKAGSGFPTGATVGRCGVAVFQKNPNIVYAVVDNNAPEPDTAKKKTDTSKYTLSDFKNISKENFLALDNKKLSAFLERNDFPLKDSATAIKAQVEKDKLSSNVIYDWLVAEDGFQNVSIHGCEVYRSDDGGISWKKVNTKKIGVYSSYGYYFGKIYVSPTDENKVITFGTEIVLSTDGGKSFKSVNGPNTHGDWHSCWINPARDGYWIAGNDGGVNITYDNGKKWFKVTSVAAGQFYNIATDNATPYNVYGGLQDNGVWVGSSKAPDQDEEEENAVAKSNPEPDVYEWKPIGGGDGMQIQVDTRDNKTAYAGSQFGYYYRKNIDTGRYFNIHPMHELGEQKLRYNWQTPILLSKHQQDILYFGSNKLFRSFNRGGDMIPLTPDLTKGKKQGNTPYGTLTTISESPLRFGLLYVGTDDGNIEVSKDGGYNFTLITKGLPANLWVSRVSASQFKESRVYATLNGYRFDDFTPYLFVSEDYGSTWKQLGTDLPAEPLNVVKEDEKKEAILYVGSDNGLYTTFDMGKTFMSMSHNLPRVPVHDLVIQQRENDLVVGTHGRSIYITSLDSVHKAYDKMQKSLQMKAALKTFDPKQMNEGDSAVDCPPVKGPKKRKNMVVVTVRKNSELNQVF